MRVYLYTLPDCGACAEAKELASAQGYDVQEVLIDNPLLELGVGMLYSDKQVRAPVMVIPDRGIYIPTTSRPMQFLRIVNLEQELQAVH